MSAATLPGVRAELAAMPPPVHGGLAEGFDFSCNLNDFLPRLSWRRWLGRVAWDRYPDPESRALRAALRDWCGIPEEYLWVGNGATELIFSLALACLRPGDACLVVGPTFSEYERACRVAHGRVHVAWPRPPAGGQPWPLQWSAAALAEAVAAVRPRVVWLCNPNNPTGQYLRRQELEPVVAASQALWVVDESYLPFLFPADDWTDLARGGQAVLVRSLTKLFRVPGLRLGYVVAHPEAVRALRAAQPSWSVHQGAQVLGAALVSWAGQHPDVLARCARRLGRARDSLARGLQAMGLRVLPSQAPFLLVEVGDGAGCTRALLRRGVAVRDASSFGLPGWIRVAVHRPALNRILVEALRAWQQESGHDGVQAALQPAGHREKA